MRAATDTTQTLTHLLAAMAEAQAVRIRYVKPTGEVSRRSIEIYALRVSAAGDVTIEGFDRRSGTRRTFRLDRVTHYTLHRVPSLATYRAPVVADQTPVIDADTDELAGFRAWSATFALAA